jgi:hypothetical protein
VAEVAPEAAAGVVADGAEPVPVVAAVEVVGGPGELVADVVERLAEVDEELAPPDPPHPGSATSKKAPRRTARHLTFAG